MAIIKHIASKNADYTVAERYLVFQHDEKTQKMLLDGDGYPMVREKYVLEGIGCDPYNFAAECRRENRKYGKNKDQREIKTHHYIISFDPEDRETSGLTMERVRSYVWRSPGNIFPDTRCWYAPMTTAITGVGISMCMSCSTACG